MKSILPIILIVLVLTGAIAYSLTKRSLPQKPTENIGIPANKLGNSPTPTPTATPTISMPEITEKTTSTITKTTICTPVYGGSDTCTEHIVVDTGAENALFFNFAGLAYLGGLASFIKAKTLKK